MQTWEFIKKHFDEKLEEQKEDTVNKIKSNTTYFNKKFDDLFATHLFKDDFIGTDTGCAGGTLIDYVHQKMPECIRKIKDNGESIDNTT